MGLLHDLTRGAEKIILILKTHLEKKERNLLILQRGKKKCLTLNKNKEKELKNLQMK